MTRAKNTSAAGAAPAAEAGEPPAADVVETPSAPAEQTPASDAEASRPADADASSDEVEPEPEIEVVVLLSIAGLRNGEPWPAPGESMTLPISEAEQYLGLGIVRIGD